MEMIRRCRPRLQVAGRAHTAFVFANILISSFLKRLCYRFFFFRARPTLSCARLILLKLLRLFSCRHMECLRARTSPTD